ncbi:MAG: hypothetical protein E7187_08680 [Erysipelotrichaceae bacterium]|nr:hypothetical protein [Erysipelotrichaceae bacterium]
MTKLTNWVTAKVKDLRKGEKSDKEVLYTYDDAIRAIISSNLGSLEKEDYINNDSIRKDLDCSYYAGIVKICSKSISGVKKGLELAKYLGKYSNG